MQVGIYPFMPPGPHTHQAPAQGGQIDHGLALTGLGDSDHAAHFDIDGSKELDGLLDLYLRQSTINAGVITANSGYMRIETEAGAATDDLVTINGGMPGRELTIRAADDTHTVVVVETGNIDNRCMGLISLATYRDVITYIFNGELNKWLLTGFSNILTKGRVDALAINADQVDGEEANAITTNARVKAHFPDTIVNILSNHTKAVHDALALSHDSLADVSVDDHHNQDHEAEHEVGGGDLVSHDALTDFAANEHVALPALIAAVLTDHNRAVHDALLLRARTLVTGVGTDLTIATGAIAVSAYDSLVRIDTEGGVANDDLTGITGGTDGQFLLIMAKDDAHTVTVKSTGNIVLEANAVLSNNFMSVLVRFDSVLSKWLEVNYHL